MKLTIENTDRVVELSSRSGPLRGRIWQGATESGQAITCVIVRVAVPIDASPDAASAARRP